MITIRMNNNLDDNHTAYLIPINNNNLDDNHTADLIPINNNNLDDPGSVEQRKGRGLSHKCGAARRLPRAPYHDERRRGGGGGRRERGREGLREGGRE